MFFGGFGEEEEAESWEGKEREKEGQVKLSQQQPCKGHPQMWKESYLGGTFHARHQTRRRQVPPRLSWPANNMTSS